MPSGAPMRTITIDAATRDRLARATFAQALRRPVAYVPVGILAMFLVVTASAAVREGGLALVPFAVAALAVLAAPAALWFVTRMAVLRAFPLGSTLSVGVVGDRLVVATPTARRDVPLVQFTGMRTTSHEVVLRTVGGASQVLPRAVFDDDQLAALGSRLGPPR